VHQVFEAHAITGLSLGRPPTKLILPRGPAITAPANWAAPDAAAVMIGAAAVCELADLVHRVDVRGVDRRVGRDEAPAATSTKNIGVARRAGQPHVSAAG
jgi:hypothetical protein